MNMKVFGEHEDRFKWEHLRRRCPRSRCGSDTFRKRYGWMSFYQHDIISLLIHIHDRDAKASKN